MVDDLPLPQSLAPLSGNKAIEDAAIAFVMKLEREAGRAPQDRRYEAAFAADISSPPRIVEVKAVGGSQRGWTLWLEVAQVNEARRLPTSTSTSWTTSARAIPPSSVSRFSADNDSRGFWSEPRNGATSRSRCQSPNTTPHPVETPSQMTNTLRSRILRVSVQPPRANPSQRQTSDLDHRDGRAAQRCA